MQTNREISAKYDKWIIKLIIKRKAFFVFWGNDKTDEDKNKMLLDSDDNLLLFKSPSAVLSYLGKKKSLFDDKNIRKWHKDFKKPGRADIIIDIDLLQNAILEFENRAIFEELINAWSIVDDYAYQTENKKMLKICQSKQIKNLFDLNCNMYLWTSIEKNVQKNMKILDEEKVVELLEKLYELFIEKVVITK
ncbi:hypothetical protein CAP35_12175 [Chitinophagaceae bacterium IBVUCB1]|nr:hypothetical protein CAP35_12175 [Chitinophagaceae bacterium IBVUCB1]